MSIRVMALCWEIPLDPSSKLLLLALADHANEAGRSVYPGNQRLARKISLQVRQTQNLLAHLELHGLIRREKHSKGGRGRAVEWSISVELLALLETVYSSSPFEEKGAVCDVKGCSLVPETMHPSTPQPSVTIINPDEFSSNPEGTGDRRPGESRLDAFRRRMRDQDNESSSGYIERTGPEKGTI